MSKEEIKSKIGKLYGQYPTYVEIGKIIDAHFALLKNKIQTLNVCEISHDPSEQSCYESGFESARREIIKLLES